MRGINNYLTDEISKNSKLSAYKGRFEIVVGSGQGRASTVGKGFLMNPNMEWNQSSLSSASNKAMETAVVNVIKAIDRRGW